MPVWFLYIWENPIWADLLPPITWMLQAGIAASLSIPPAVATNFEAMVDPTSWHKFGATTCMHVSKYIIKAS